MKREDAVAIALGALCALPPPASAQAAAPKAVTQTTVKGKAMTSQARGTFEVKVKPLPEDVKVPGVAVGRLSIDKVRGILGWTPKLDDIDTIVRTSLDWEKKLQREPW